MRKIDEWWCRHCQKKFDEYYEKCPVCGGRVKEIPREEEEPKVKLVRPKAKKKTAKKRE